MNDQLSAPAVDVIVLGAGMAGLVAAVRLAEAGLRVTTVAKGYGSLRLAPATIDILGYRPDPVDSPAQALPGFAAAHPEHPYAQISPAVLAEAVQWLKEHVGTYAYVGDPDANMLLPTALGVPRPSAVVPETMAAGDLRSAGPLVIAGFGVLKDFHPALVAENLEAATAARGRAVKARPVLLNPPARRPGRRGRPGPGPAVRGRGVPRRGGGRTAHGRGRRRRRSGCRRCSGWIRPGRSGPSCSRPPGGRCSRYPPRSRRRCPACGWPGRCRTGCAGPGGRFVLGAEAAGPELRNSELVGVRIRAAARVTPRTCRWVVLATGGLSAGGIQVDVAGALSERALGLPVHGPGPGEAGFLPGYLGDHPMETAGLRVDGSAAPGRTGRRAGLPERVRGRRGDRRGQAVAGEVRGRHQPVHRLPGRRCDPEGGRMTAEHEFDIIRDSLDHCVKCTICESACPVAAVTPLFPGTEVRRPAGRAVPRTPGRRSTPPSTTAPPAASAPWPARRASTWRRSTPGPGR